MLTEVEVGLIQLIKGSAINGKVRAVETLPDIDGDELVRKFASVTPGIYVAPQESFQIVDGEMRPGWSVSCVVKNAGGHEKGRHGDGKAIGLYDMVEFLASFLNGRKVGELVLYANKAGLLNSELLYKAGLQVAVIELNGNWLLDGAIDESGLADFETFDAQYDIAPHVSGTEHAKWVGDPHDHSSSKPELTDVVNIQ